MFLRFKLGMSCYVLGKGLVEQSSFEGKMYKNEIKNETKQTKAKAIGIKAKVEECSLSEA